MLGEAEEQVLERCKKMEFASLDEFFDCYVFKHVLRKFATDNLWYDLEAAEPGVGWSDYVDYSRKQGILQFLPSQRDAIQKGLLTYEHSFSLKMPTSAGKSLTLTMTLTLLNSTPQADLPPFAGTPLWPLTTG